LKTFDDGSEERGPIVKAPRKKWLRSRIDWSRKLSTGLKRDVLAGDPPACRDRSVKIHLA
jgi:hypothetical protein